MRLDPKHIADLGIEANKALPIIWARFVKLYPELVNFRQPIAKINNRFKSTGGVCKCDVRIIELSAEMFFYNQEEYYATIIPHEVAHQVDYDLTGNIGHGKTWKMIMVAYGLQPNRCHNMVNPMQIKRNQNK